ncbi:MAG: hypothetical protein EBX69_09550 [Betaproteobacteria bacterium]|nr:hypothetical protein [Betaproteobacteria bacterium]
MNESALQTECLLKKCHGLNRPGNLSLAQTGHSGDLSHWSGLMVFVSPRSNERPRQTKAKRRGRHRSLIEMHEDPPVINLGQTNET